MHAIAGLQAFCRTCEGTPGIVADPLGQIEIDFRLRLAAMRMPESAARITRVSLKTIASPGCSRPGRSSRFYPRDRRHQLRSRLGRDGPRASAPHRAVARDEARWRYRVARNRKDLFALCRLTAQPLVSQAATARPATISQLAIIRLPPVGAAIGKTCVPESVCSAMSPENSDAAASISTAAACQNFSRSSTHCEGDDANGGNGMNGQHHRGGRERRTLDLVRGDRC